MRARRLGAELEMRAGIALGLIDGLHPTSGATIERAARLARAAQAGQALVSSAIAEALTSAWELRPAGVLPRRAEDMVDDGVALEGRRTAASAPSLFAPGRHGPLVGRRGELDALTRELQLADGQRGRWCAVVAPAGGGKSALLHAWLEDVRERATIAGAGASPFGAAPLSLVADVLRSLRAEPPEESMPSSADQRILARLAHAIRAAAPVVVIIDDLHWADQRSLKILRHLSSIELPGCLVIIAVRRMFLDAVPWLPGQRIELPGLRLPERRALVKRLLAESRYEQAAMRLAERTSAQSPLYLEQAAAYIQERNPDADPPASLHEVVLARLRLLVDRVRRPLLRPSAAELTAVEEQLSEWLDRLETTDYEERSAVARYLALLESIDLDLIIAHSLAGVPVARNRRLLDALERFYSASFPERAQALIALAEDDRLNAAHAASIGADRASRAVRLADAVGYRELAVQWTDAPKRAGELTALGDLQLTRGQLDAAARAYEQALTEDKARPVALRRRLARVRLAMDDPDEAETLLGATDIETSNDEERTLATIDGAIITALRGDTRAAQQRLERIHRLGAPTDPAIAALFARARLRVALLARDTRRCEPAADVVGRSFAGRDRLTWLAELVETVTLVRRAAPDRVAPGLLSAARAAAQSLGNPLAIRKLSHHEPAWHPIHPKA